MAISKYRPVLTAGQIAHMLSLAQAHFMSKPEGLTIENDTRDISFSIIATLSPFKAKIDALAINPTYTTKPDRASALLESLGEDVPASSISDIPANFISKEAYWSYCYNKWQADPTSCTMAEFIASNEHRYLYDLMSPEEVAKHEAKVGS